jgi:hypothetical protein
VTNFSYNNAIPATNNNPSTDQPGMLTNAISIDSILAIDHVGFNATNGGTHNQSTYNNLIAKPAILATQGAVYTKSVGGTSQLFFENSAAVETQLTGGPQSLAATGYTTLPGGIKIKWGSVSVTANSTATLTYNATDPFTTVYSVTIGALNVNVLNDQPYIKSQTVANCVITNPSGQTWQVFITAIGV